MANMSLTKNKMPMLDPIKRSFVFDEVSLGYSFKVAKDEAERCLNCANKPCVEGCPVNIDIPSFINELKNNNIDKAYEIISKSSSLSSICGRVCPQETQCESKCTRGLKGEPVAIGRLERFVADEYNKKPFNVNKCPSNGKKVAIVGSGPSGLSCSYDLVIKGYDVTIFEALHLAGGVLVYGIPEFRLPKKIVQHEIEKLTQLGVHIRTNVVIGKTLTIDDLRNEFDAIYIANGAGLPMFMNIKGESLNGVYSANEFLTRANLMKAYDNSYTTPINVGGVVAVVGGGNVAMDAARTALRLDADKVYIVYRRSMEELPARKEEVEHALEEGVEFKLLTNPVEIIGDDKNNVKMLKCIKMKLGEPDERGRRRPIEVEGSEFEINVDTVIMSLGTSPNPLIKNTTPSLEFNSRGGIVVDDNGKTSIDGIYAGGDSVTGAATVISAMGAGKNAAKSIDDYLKNNSDSNTNDNIVPDEKTPEPQAITQNTFKYKIGDCFASNNAFLGYYSIIELTDDKDEDTQRPIYKCNAYIKHNFNGRFVNRKVNLSEGALDIMKKIEQLPSEIY